MSKILLIVDDNKELATILSDKLSGEMCTVVVAHDGQEGLQKATEIKPDLIMLDVMMPVMTGWEMLEALRLDDWGKSAEVLMFTNVSDMDSISKALDYGSFEYIVKADRDIDDIVTRIKEKLLL